ncbi:PorP/SprF family type IX secretion system membrane protein [Pricia sp.]|uniref:PorP/SprF family type IX secretion system membrane protein n=1 Tax=Pricia sp. TaxID=2268138 RepID=UPI003593F593
MNRPLFTLFLVFIFTAVRGQQERLPADLRQHNLTTYNASLFNPAFSMGRNNPESVAFWARWQWQGIDADPSTLFLNYTRSLNDRSAAGAGFFQHNTGIFFNTGAALNYAYTFELNSRVKLAVGANLFGFVQKVADDRFQVDPNLPLPLPAETNDFILQMAPGISLEIERLTLSLASENLLDYNFKAKEGNTAKSDKIFMSLLSYDFPVSLGTATNAFLRPSMYLRTIPGQSNQVGFYTLLNTDGYYGQVGYNNFYGYALGGGYTFFKRVTLGALMEIGTGASIQKETSFELMASYFLGTPNERHKMVGHDIDRDDKNPLEEIEEKQKNEESDQDAIDETLEIEESVIADERLEQEKKEAEEARAEAERMEQARKMDASNKAKQVEEAALKKEQQHMIDSMAQARAAAIQAAKKAEVLEKEPVVTPEAGEKYEEVHTEDGLEPGFYLIANVFGTQKYFEAFVADLKKKGMQPKSFQRSKNGYHYVYLQRYGAMQEARTARDTKFNGKYSGSTWIFRVVAE